MSITSEQPQVPLSQVVGSSAYGLYLDSDQQLDADLGAVVSSGVSMLRLDLFWTTAEQRRGQFDWRQTDRVVTAARSKGLDVLLMVSDVPAWARPVGTTQMRPPTDPSSIAPFLKAAAEHYKPMGVETWEIFNEVNTRRFWDPSPDAAAYVALLKSAYGAIKSVEPDSTVLSAGLVSASDAADHSSQSPLTYLTQMYAAGAAGSFDGVALHPYTYPLSPLSGSVTRSGFLQLPLLYALMDSNGDKGKRIWATEMGWSTCTVSTYCVTPAQQATFTEQAIVAWRSQPRNGPIFLYGLRDTVRPSDPEANFGYLQPNGSPKPVFFTMKKLTGAASRNVPIHILDRILSGV